MRLSTTLLILAFTGTLWSQIPCNGEFLTTGSASDMGSCIQLTPNSTNQQGCAWLNTPVDFSMPFTHTMTANFGFSDAGADGICLIYQSNGTGVCGLSGGGIGALGIPNSFIVEFDTWENGLYDDIPADHCAVNINGDFTTSLNGPVPLANIEDGANHTITFSWDPGSMSYNISFDGVGILGGTFDIINNCFGGNPLAYWGYSSSTGAATNTQTICPVLPPPIVLDAGIDTDVPCASSSFTLNGSVSPFNPNYIYQWTTQDGTILSGSGTLNPQVSGPGTYTLTLTDPNGGCMETDQIVISINPIIAAIVPPPFFPCDGSPVFLDGSPSSSGPFITYQWTTSNGLILSGANTTMPMIGAPGFYNLTVTYNDGAGLVCTENETVQVFEDTNIPFASAMDGVITCDPGFTVLNGLGSTMGNNISYQWSTFDGLIISDGTTLFPTVGAPGVYTLRVTNIGNGCFDEVDVVVTGDLTAPTAMAVVDGDLDCQNQTLIINGSGSSQGPNISYEWITPNGNIVSGSDSDSPTVDAAGDYTLIVTNTVNGCTDFADVTVLSSGAASDITIQPADTLTCAIESLVLDASSSDQGTNFSYTWTTNDGNIVADTFGLNPVIDAPGTYYFSVENNDNGCISVDSVEVEENLNPPTVEAGNPQILSCNEDFIELSGNATANGNVDFIWSTPDGQIISDENLASIQVDAAGTYFLQATDTGNGCSAIDSVLIGLDNDVPSITMIADDTLNCTVNQILIDASGSDQGSDLTFIWSTTDGNFVSGESTLQVLINAAGTYNLQITNTNNDCSNDMDLLIVQDTLSPEIQILEPDTLDCNTNQVSINANGSSMGGPFSYHWSSTDGNILNGENGLNPVVNEPGTYILNIDNTQNNCSNEASIVVEQDTISPTIIILSPSDLTCTQTDQTLDATGSSSGPAFITNWTTNDGNISSGGNGLNPSIDAPGIYQLEIENTTNGCSHSATVTVNQDITPPAVDAGQDMVLNCNFPSIELDGTASSSGPNFDITWTDDSNTVVDNTNNLSPTISNAGTYILEILNTNNGCSAHDTVLVGEDFVAPISSIALPGNLTCTDSLVQLDGSASTSGVNIVYQWSTPNGNIFSNTDQAQAEASQAGHYFLLVENTENGCTDLDSTQVMQDANFPIANIDPASTLSCNIQNITLQGTAIANTSNLDFQWNTSDGNFISGSNSLAPVIDQPGTYTLEVTDLDNNCQAMASINILQDIATPTVDAGPSMEVNCNFPSLALDGSGSDQGSQFAYNWTTEDGHILSGANGLSPQIDAAGNYMLIVNNQNNGCVDSAQVLVTADFAMPDFVFISPDTLYCDVNTVDIYSTTTLDPTISLYGWTTQNGNIQAGQDSTTIVVDAPGIYFFTLENVDNGCVATDSIEVFQDIEVPLIQLAMPQTLNCLLNSQQLSAQGSDNGTPFILEWTTSNGNILSGANSLTPEIDQPGIYQFQITNTVNACSSIEAITVNQDIEIPTLSINNPPTLNCNTTQTNLNANNSSSGANFSANWTTTEGNILSGENGLTPLINLPGFYQLAIENTQNGCIDSTLVEVMQDVAVPAIEIQTPLILDCNIVQQTLDATNSSSGPMFVYNWESNDGQILEGSDGAQPLIDEPGTYTLSIVNLQNGCDSSQSILVQQDITRPDLVLAEPPQLNCAITQTNLDATGSSAGTGFDYLWSTPNGNLIGALDIPNPLVDQPGEYSLQISNTTNGCDTSASVNVSQDITLPMLQIEQPPVLNCSITTISIDGSGSDAGANFEPEWSSTSGNSITNPGGLTPSVQAPGFYTLTILNTANECQDSLTIEVLQDIIAPDIEIQVPQLLTCDLLAQMLDATNSSTGTQFDYLWTTSDGQITQGTESSTPVIDQPGTYTLTISNTENGCDSIQSILVQQDISAPDLFIETPEQLNCTIDQTILDGSNSSTGPLFEYEWTTADGNILSGINSTNPTINEPGTYNFLVRNTFNGCDTIASVLVTENVDGPIGSIQTPEVLNCIVESIALDASNSSSGANIEYNWTTTSGNIVSGSNSLIPVIDQPGVYTLHLLNNDNLCADTVSIEVLQDIVPPVAEAGDNFILPCFEDTAPLDGSGSSVGTPFVYQWTSSDGTIASGANTLSPDIGAAGTYVLLVSNTTNGCEQSDQVTVSQTIPVAEVNLMPPLCHDDPAALTIANVNMGVTPYVFSIDGGETFFSDPIFNNLGAGHYDVVVQDVNGCQYEEAVEIQQADSVVVIVPEAQLNIKLGESIQIFTQTNIPESDIASISWQHDGSLACDTCLHPIVKPFQTTDYKVFIENINGCSDEALVKVFVDKRVDVYIPNAFSPGNADGFNDRFYIFARPESVLEVKSFQVFSRWGEVLYEAFGFQPNDPVYGWDGLYRGQRLNTGVYVYWAEIEMIDGSVVLFKGDVTLMD